MQPELTPDVPAAGILQLVRELFGVIVRLFAVCGVTPDADILLDLEEDIPAKNLLFSH